MRRKNNLRPQQQQRQQQHSAGQESDSDSLLHRFTQTIKPLTPRAEPLLNAGGSSFSVCGLQSATVMMSKSGGGGGARSAWRLWMT